MLLNRKMLSQLAIENPGVFDRLVEMAKGQGGGATQDAEPAREPDTAPV